VGSRIIDALVHRMVPVAGGVPMLLSWQFVEIRRRLREK
jgi:hypothetical protein